MITMYQVMCQTGGRLELVSFCTVHTLLKANKWKLPCSVYQILKSGLNIQQCAQISPWKVDLTFGNVHRHHPDKWHTSKWILDLDNSPAHRLVITNTVLVKHNILLLHTLWTLLCLMCSCTHNLRIQGKVTSSLTH